MTLVKPDQPSTLVTVTSQGYLPGTAVMLHSFLTTNSWFDGQIEILQNDLKQAEKDDLLRISGRICFPDISPALTQAIDALTASRDHLASRARRFFSLDAFRPDRSGAILFCDGDLLFQGDISEFCDAEGPFIACGDRAQIEGNMRDPVTLVETQDLGVQNAGANSGFRSFNAGLMLIRPQLRGDAAWSAILEQLQPGSWDSVGSSHTDQAVLNRIFGETVSLGDPRFNFLIGHAGKMRDAAGLKLNDAAVLHFNNATKPWLFRQHAAATARDPAVIKAFDHWFTAYSKYLTAQHFRGG